MVTASELLDRFSFETGLEGDQPPNRYLWTDAFAVCTDLGLYLTENDKNYLDRAKKLIQQVHTHLGTYHPKDERSGWLADEAHPTAQGLRIGKPLPERAVNAPIDQEKEWERDGQYFHYLTKWIYALVRTFETTDNEKFLHQARDLGLSSMAFVRNETMVWKMSTDLSYPLVKSMGKHDPLDGYITFLEMNQYLDSSRIDTMIATMDTILHKVDLRNTDTLGIGGLLLDYYRLYRINPDHSLLDQISAAIEWGLDRAVIPHTLAFRELGLALGLVTAEQLDILTSYLPIRQEINDYWQDRHDFQEHRQINTIMLAASIHPTGYYRE